MKKIGLLGRIVIAIALAVGIGSILAQIPEKYGLWFVELGATFNMLFGGFLSFVVPLIIIGFIAPGIAKLGKGSAKMLGLSTGLAYASTIIAGILAFFVASNVLPGLIGAPSVDGISDPSEALASAFFELEIVPIMGVLTSLIFAFLMGIGMAATGSKTLISVFEEFQNLIEKTISSVIIPLLPFHIFGVFLNMTYAGQVASVLSVFAMVFVLIIAMHLFMLLLQYTAAGALTQRNPFRLLKTMAPAYFTALGTQSSAATIPVTVRQARKTGASDKVVDFTVPLFANIHLSGSTITLTTCAIGVMLMNGTPVTIGPMMQFIAVLGVTMIAAPGVPGGAVMAALGLLSSMLGFTEPMIALMIALYMAQDSFGTATNVTGDGALAIITDRFANSEEAASSPAAAGTKTV